MCIALLVDSPDNRPGQKVSYYYHLHLTHEDMSLNLCGFGKKKKTQLTSYFEIILISAENLQKQWTESSCVLFPQPHQPKDSLSLLISEAKWG